MQARQFPEEIIMRHASEKNSGFSLTRRQFAQMAGAFSLLGLIEPQVAARALAGDRKRLSWLAYRNASAEGAWALTKIEGKVPKELNGTLYRTAPGQKENHGVVLQHLFDGDAYVCGYSFREGKVHLRGRYIDTPPRVEELKTGRMLYGEFGTNPPPPPEGWKPAAGGKNQPSVNIIEWDGRLLGLSEGGHPTAIDPVTLAYQSRWDFHGTLPPDNPFTAHPKFDPTTGEGYGYGVRRGPGLPLTVYRMERDGKLTRLYALPQKNYPIVHDMLLSRDHIVFVIPPVSADFRQFGSGKTVADALVFAEKEPMRFVILRKDGQGKPVAIDHPAGFVFHHGNAFEREGKIVVDTFLTSNASILDALYSWSKDKVPVPSSIKLTRLTLDPASAKIESSVEMAINQEFPRFDSRRAGQDARHLYALEGNVADDPFAFTALIRHDLQRKSSKRIEAGKGRILGEPVFVPHPGRDAEDRGWILMQGYDGPRDENYLEIRDAGTMDFAARVWTGQHFALGFHGNFSPERFVTL
jgi:all-trans-8'-apo-beta-carotenal 15,15'-oxygenase